MIAAFVLFAVRPAEWVTVAGHLVTHLAHLAALAGQRLSLQCDACRDTIVPPGKRSGRLNGANATEVNVNSVPTDENAVRERDGFIPHWCDGVYYALKVRECSR